ncbi:hypothetical protein [Enterococcus sp. AZ196]|uniref:hypothetical protein n=1 Tax=Enterococcus sp. AZ196 TaxID=2774659 RepID=UPI003D2A5F2D
MMKHKKGMTSAALLFIGMLSFATLRADAAVSGEGVQNLRYCTINNIYKAPREDCPLRQNHILNGFDQRNGTGAQNGYGNGKQDGTGQANGPRIPNCPNYEEKQDNATTNTPQPNAAEATNYAVQPQDGTGNQYGQQNTDAVDPQQFAGNGYGNGDNYGQAGANQQANNETALYDQNVGGGQQNSENSAIQPSTYTPQAGQNQQNGAGRAGTHHGLRDGSGAGGQRGRGGHCY